MWHVAGSACCASSGSRPSRAGERLKVGCAALDPETRRLSQALPYDAVALRQDSKPGEVVVVRVGVQLGDELDGTHADGGFTGDPEGAASVKLAFRVEPGEADVDAECGRHASHGDARAGQQGLHGRVPGAGVAAIAVGGRMQPGSDGSGP
jgi:hypothetical protein